MAFESKKNVVLLSVKPKYANAIFSGEKTVEFRKQRFKQPVSHIVVYSSSPEKRVIGYFEVGSMNIARPMTIWKKYRHNGCISFQDYKQYFDGKSQAVAYEVKTARKLMRPISLGRLQRGLKAPQGYHYLPGSCLNKLEILCV